MVVNIAMEPIGFVRTNAVHIPRHWTLSDVEGSLVIDERYRPGLKDIKKNQRIVVIFHFHKSRKFTSGLLKQTPPNGTEALGVFSICSPMRPNPIGMSVLRVLEVRGNVIDVQGLDMMDGTPILDIKPYIENKNDCPSYEGQRRPTDS
jgi:tRNA-Thr(GGU) m(6)t(6)A37 methyltransferase TsaA